MDRYRKFDEDFKVGAVRLVSESAKPIAQVAPEFNELRQNLSRYLERVKAGEAFVVTERGREVARLTPSGDRLDGLARLISERGASIPQGDLLANLAPRRSVDGPSTAEMLAEQRAERL